MQELISSHKKLIIVLLLFLVSIPIFFYFFNYIQSNDVSNTNITLSPTTTKAPFVVENINKEEKKGVFVINNSQGENTAEKPEEQLIITGTYDPTMNKLEVLERKEDSYSHTPHTPLDPKAFPSQEYIILRLEILSDKDVYTTYIPILRNQNKKLLDFSLPLNKESLPENAKEMKIYSSQNTLLISKRITL